MITSKTNAQVKLIKSLATAKGRKAAGLTLLEGKKWVTEALAKGQVHTLLLREDQKEALSFEGPTMVFSVSVFDSFSETKTPQGVSALVSLPDTQTLPQGDHLLVLDGLQDAGNVGGLIRTAAGLGVAGVITTPGTADPFSPKALRASAGTALGLPVAVGFDAANLMAWFTGHTVLVADAGGAAMQKPDGPWVLVLGSEGQGPASAWSGTKSVGIPVAVESLNVMAAGAILLDRLVGPKAR